METTRRGMLQSTAWLSMVVLLLHFAAPAALAKSDREQIQQIPAFRLKGLDGQDFVASEELAGRTTLIVFWRLGQSQSVSILEDLVELRATMPVQEVAIVSVVSGDTDREQVAQLAEGLEISFPVLFDPDRQLYAEFGMIVSPSSWFANSSGQIRFDYPGYRRDFARVAKAELAFLTGKISETDLSRQLTTESAGPLQDKAGPSTRLRLARRLLAQGDRDAAEQQLWIAWKDDPRVAEVGVELAMLQLSKGQNGQALAIVDEALEAAPGDPRGLGAKGMALTRLGRREEGISHLRRAIEAGASEPVFYYELALGIEKEQGAESASPYYRRGLELMLTPPPGAAADPSGDR
jgi:peroxiredoxin